MDGIAYRLREVRDRTGLGTRGFALELGRRAGYQVSHSSVAQYEGGTTIPAPYVEAVTRAFRVDARWLLTGEGLPEQNDPSDIERAFTLIARAVQRARAAPSTVESQFDAFFRLSPDLMQILTPEGYVVRVNPACEAITGFPPETVLTVPFHLRLHPDDRARTRELMERLLDHDAPVAFEVRHRRSDGGYLWMSWVAAHSDGLIYAAGRDATDQREVNRALRMERDFTEGVLAEMQELIVVTDDEGRIVWINRKAAKLVGLGRHEALGLDFPEVLLPPEARAEWNPRLARLRRGVRALNWEVDLLSSHGGGYRIGWTFATMRDEAGSVRHVVGLGTDVTEQRKMESALRASQETLAAVVNSVPDGLFMVDQAGRIRWANRRMCELFGYPEGGLAGVRLECLVPDDLRGHHASLQADYLAMPHHGYMTPGRTVNGLRRDRSLFEIEVLLSPVEPPDSGVVGRVTPRGDVRGSDGPPSGDGP